jgi:hypothetical protein
MTILVTIHLISQCQVGRILIWQTWYLSLYRDTAEACASRRWWVGYVRLRRGVSCVGRGAAPRWQSETTYALDVGLGPSASPCLRSSQSSRQHMWCNRLCIAFKFKKKEQPPKLRVLTCARGCATLTRIWKLLAFIFQSWFVPRLHESGAEQSTVLVLKGLREVEVVDCDMRLYAWNTCHIINVGWSRWSGWTSQACNNGKKLKKGCHYCNTWMPCSDRKINLTMEYQFMY